MHKLPLIAAIAILPLASADAALFKCNEDGNIVYQGVPCKGAGSELTPPPQDAPAAPEKGAPSESAARAAKFDEQAKTLSLEHQIREIDYETPKLEAELAEYQTAMKSELDALQQKKEYWKNQLGGSTWEHDVEEEMQAVSEKYKAKIQAAQDRLNRLYKQKADLNDQLSQGAKSERKQAKPSAPQ